MLVVPTHWVPVNKGKKDEKDNDIYIDADYFVYLYSDLQWYNHPDHRKGNWG